MKEIVSLAASHLTVFAESQPVPLTEIVLVVSEPEYVFDTQGELAKRRALSQTRFAATTAELREIATTLTHWADERDMIAFQPEEDSKPTASLAAL